MCLSLLLVKALRAVRAKHAIREHKGYRKAHVLLLAVRAKRAIRKGHKDESCKGTTAVPNPMDNSVGTRFVPTLKTSYPLLRMGDPSVLRASLAQQEGNTTIRDPWRPKVAIHSVLCCA